MLWEALASRPAPDALPLAFADPEVFAFAAVLAEASAELPLVFAEVCEDAEALSDAFTSALFLLFLDVLGASVLPFEEDCTFADVLADAFTFELP